jgi:hypothetical protein
MHSATHQPDFCWADLVFALAVVGVVLWFLAMASGFNFYRAFYVMGVL